MYTHATPSVHPLYRHLMVGYRSDRHVIKGYTEGLRKVGFRLTNIQNLVCEEGIPTQSLLR